MTYAQCDIPLTFSGNTGANMTVMLTPDFISSLTITDADAYVVASTDDGMVVGSQLYLVFLKPRLQFGEMIHQLLI